MQNNDHDFDELVVWQRVGTLAWIVGYSKSENPFRRLLVLHDASEVVWQGWQAKLHAWDAGWDNAAAREARDDARSQRQANIAYAANNTRNATSSQALSR